MSDSTPTRDPALSPLKRALLAIERLQAQVEHLQSRPRQPLAVVGMGCRFPAGDDPDAYYEALRSGYDAVRPRPPVARPGWRASEADSDFPFPPAGYLAHDVSQFDPGFFGISPREAASIDPQQRLLLEVVWEAFEHAAIDPRGLEGSRTGVFVGMAGNDYATLQLSSERALELLNSHFTSGIGQSMASGRIAYLLGLQGPALTVDTACSSSLVAVHLASQSLRSGESDMALAAGTNLILSDDFTRAFGESRMLAPDGRCKTFDAAADGFGRGEGCGVVILKRLEDARAAGDRIFALVRGTAVNQDGPSSGLTAPNGPAQEAVIREALRSGDLNPADVGYVEAHGTGTALGDPMEVQALGAVFGSGDRDAPLEVGSVKTNMGHLEASAGIAGFIKVVQTVRHGWIPPHLHLSEPSPHIPWTGLGVHVPTEVTPLARTGGRRRAGVSSFGFSGTNAHVVVEEPPEERKAVPVERPASSIPGDDDAIPAHRPTAAERPLHVLALSAPSEAGLRETVQRHAQHLAAFRGSEGATSETGSEGTTFADVAFTAGSGRAHHAHRLGVVAPDTRSARSALDAWLAGGSGPAVRTGRLHRPDRPPLAFLFTGQGSQYPGMGWALRDASPAFRRALDACADGLRNELEIPLLEVLDPTGPHAHLVHRTDYTQPALFALQYALTAMWAAWGIRPDVVMGHSIGEYAAAHVAGAFSLDDALRLVAARGRLMQAVESEGRMLAVMASEERVASWVEAAGHDASVAAVNAPHQTVVSGGVEAVAAVAAAAAGAGVETKALPTSQAFHSPLMDPAVEGLETVLEGVTLTPPRRVRFVSTVTGQAAAPDDLADPVYWARQLRQPVRFVDAAASVAALATTALEIGPHPTLRGLLGQGDAELTVHPSLHRDRGPWETLIDSVSALYVEGVTPSWSGLEEGRSRSRVDLPRHPFQRTRHWVHLGSGGRDDRTGAHPLLGRRRSRPGPGRDYEVTLRDDAPAFIGEHRVLGRPILPGTAFLEMALAAGGETLARPVAVDGLDLLAAMDFGEGGRRVHVSVATHGADRARVEVHSTTTDEAENGWTLHACGDVVAADLGTQDESPADLEALRARCPEPVSGGDFYDDLLARGYAFGPRLKGIRELWIGTDEALARVELPDACVEDPGDYRIHPLLLDAALQAVGPALRESDVSGTYLPVWVERLHVAPGDPGRSAWVHVRITGRGVDSRSADVRLLDDTGVERARLGGVTFRAIAASTLTGAPPDPLLHVRWVPKPVSDEAPTASPDVRARTDRAWRSTLAREATREDAAAYDTFVEDLEARAAAWIVRAFDALGWGPASGSTVSLEDVARSLGVVDTRRRLLARSLDILAEEGILEPTDDGWTVVSALPVADAPLSTSFDQPPEAVLLDRCGPHLADILRGRGDPLELLFPGGDSSVAEAMYHDTPPARIFNRSVADALSVAREAAGDRPLRVLEVGAGTGGTTGHVLDRLATDDGDAPPVDYTFTDVSPLFVDRARRRWEGTPGMSFRTLDLDRPLDAQGFDSGAYDVVLATNSLHAARDLAAAVAAVGGLLRPGGMLLAVEVFSPHRWFDLTVGLTDGWWNFTDTDLRPGYACVPPAAWCRVLDSAGFDHTAAVPLSEVAATDGLASEGQGVVVGIRNTATSFPSAGPWLVIEDEAGVGAATGAALADAGLAVESLPATEVTDAVLADVLSGHARWSGILHCAGIATDRSLDPDALAERLRVGLGSLLTAAGCAIAGATRVDALCVLTRGGQVVDAHDADTDPAAAALWGLMRTVALEAPGLRRRCLDLDPAGPFEPARAIRWLTSDRAESEEAFRGGATTVRRLVPRARDISGDRPGLPDDYRLDRPGTGGLDDMVFTAGRRTPPGPGQVEIRVVASALNFKDVLNVLGMYPGDAGPLGSECAGVVSAVGDGVDMPLGTPVVAAAGHAYGKHVIADASLVADLPAGLSFGDGATLPVAYLTAAFALEHLGHIGPDDRVLIHAAAGGVGTAARALARRAGATIFATAGSEEKRALLRAQGVEHVYDSRSGAFAEDILRDTDGDGVTVVLNSLADDLVDRSFEVVADGGRFLEIGKRGIWSPERVEALGRSIDYHVIDWGATYRDDPARVGRIFRSVMEGVSSGALSPLPATVFPVAKIRDAFRYMAQARHVGKVVLAHPVVTPDGPVAFRPDATYLVTGGLSGLGLETAEWAAARGAATLVLAGRRDAGTHAQARIEALREQGVSVHVRRCDVGDRDDVEALVAWITETLPPLRGVVHSAGTLADRTLEQLTWQDFEAVLSAKAHGPALLRHATRHAPPDFFVAYSSIAGTLGSPGQGNHAAANAFLDAYCATLWRIGTVGMSIAWGPWAETGAATDDDALARTEALGLGSLSNAEGLALLGRATDDPGPFLVATRVEEPAALAARRTDALLDDLVAGARSAATADPTDDSGTASTGAATLPALLDATPREGRRRLVTQRVRDRVRTVLGLGADADVEPERPLGDFGLDSLLAVELRNVLGADAECRLPATLLFDHPTVAALTDHLLELLSPDGAGHADPIRTPALRQSDPSAPLDDLDELSDDEVERLLAEKMRGDG